MNNNKKKIYIYVTAKIADSQIFQQINFPGPRPRNISGLHKLPFYFEFVIDRFRCKSYAEWNILYKLNNVFREWYHPITLRYNMTSSFTLPLVQIAMYIVYYILNLK